MKQVLINLLVNARQALDEVERPKVEVSTRIEDGDLLIDLADNGTGIEEDNLLQIFNPFFTTKAEGTGLGLAIAHQIVENHAGTLTVTSSLGEGTTFKIRVSLDKA